MGRCFTRHDYAQIILDSFTYYWQHKGMQLWAYVIMTYHIRVMMSSKEQDLSGIVRDFKKFTANSILRLIELNPKESRKEWILNQFAFAAKKHKRNSNTNFGDMTIMQLSQRAKNLFVRKWHTFIIIQ